MDRIREKIEAIVDSWSEKQVDTITAYVQAADRASIAAGGVGQTVGEKAAAHRAESPLAGTPLGSLRMQVRRLTLEATRETVIADLREETSPETPIEAILGDDWPAYPYITAEEVEWIVRETQPEALRIRRDGELDIAARGWLLSSADSRRRDQGDTRWTEVNIWRTVGGSWITGVADITQYEDEVDRYRAAVHTDPAAALEWLRDDNEGRLGRISRAAWEAACAIDPELRGFDVEHVA